MEETPKPWWQSTGVIGSLVAIVASGAGLIGVTVTPDDQLALVDGVIKLGAVATQAVGLVGGFVALWGRIRATRPIG